MQANSMKFFRLILFCSVAFGLAPRAGAEPNLADGVKAVVNDTVITYSQVQDSVAPEMQALQLQYASQPDLLRQKAGDLLRDGLEQLVERELILRNFDVQGYHLPDSVVDQLVADRIRDRYQNRITLMKTLQKEGMTYDQFRSQVREQYIVSALRSKNVAQEIVISPYKVETYYLQHTNDYKLEDEVNLRMISLKKSGSDDTNTAALAHEVVLKIKEGASFQEMAASLAGDSSQRQGDAMCYI